MTNQEVKDHVLEIAHRYLPNAIVENLDFDESCGCYSEVTTEAPYLNITLAAPWNKSDKDLSHLVGTVEDEVKNWAKNAISFNGCSCCCNDCSWEDPDPDCDHSSAASIYVRVIPN